MVEVEKDNTRAIAGSGLGLGIAGTALGLLNGGLGNVLGGCGTTWNGCGSNYVNRYEAEMQSKISALESDIKLRDATTFVLEEANKMRNYVDTRFSNIEAQLCQQNVVNAQITANISCMQRNLDVLNGLTKTIIPIANICPTPAIATTTPTTKPTKRGGNTAPKSKEVAWQLLHRSSEALPPSWTTTLPEHTPG